MAVRYTANGEYLRNDNIVTRLNYNDRYTMMVWYYVVAHHATVNLGFLWHCNTAITTYDAFGQESTSNGEQLYVGDNVSGLDYSAGAIAASTWHHVSMVRYSSTLLRGFLNGVQFGTDRTGNVGARAVATRTFIGNPSASYYISARFAHAKLWNVPLSPEEIQAEMWSNAPVTNLRNVVTWSPLMAENRSADYGPFGLAWTEIGTLTDEADPEIPLRAAARVETVRRWWIPPPPGTTYTQSLDAEMEPLTYAGAVVWPTKQLLRTLAASLTPSGALTYLKSFFRTLTAGLTPAANLMRGMARTLTAGLTPTANLVRSVLRTLAAEMEPLTYAGGVVWPTKQLLRTLAAGLTPTGALTYLKAIFRTLTAGLTPTANLVRSVLRTLAAEMEPLTYAGGVVWPTKQLLRTLAAGLTPTGALAYLKAVFLTLTAGLTPTANLVRSVLRTLAAEMEPLTYAGGVVWPTKQLLRTLAAGLTPTGALTYLKAIFRTLTAGLTPTANLIKGTARTLTAGLTPTANLIKGTARTLTAGLTPSANLVRGTVRTLAAGLTPTGALAPLKAFLRTLTAGLTPTANLVRSTLRTLTAEMEPLTYAGGVVWPTKQLLRTLAASLTPTANLVRGIARTLAAGLTPTSALSAIRAYLLTLAAGLTPTGSLVRSVRRTLTASLTPLASVLRLLIGVVGGRARCTLTVQAATTCGLRMSEV